MTVSSLTDVADDLTQLGGGERVLRFGCCIVGKLKNKSELLGCGTKIVLSYLLSKMGACGGC